MLSCSRDLSVSKNNPSRPSERWWESPVPVRVSRCGQASRHHHRGRGGSWPLLVSPGCPPRGEEPSRWPLQVQAWPLLCFAAFHVVRGSSWEQMTQQPESLGLSGLSAFREVIGHFQRGPKILSPASIRIQTGFILDSSGCRSMRFLQLLPR